MTLFHFRRVLVICSEVRSLFVNFISHISSLWLKTIDAVGAIHVKHRCLSCGNSFGTRTAGKGRTIISLHLNNLLFSFVTLTYTGSHLHVLSGKFMCVALITWVCLVCDM